MASGLRAKLNAIASADLRTRSAPTPAGGVAVYTSRRTADPRLFKLDPQGLLRMGWPGRPLDVHRLLFLDTETTGLSGGAGTVAFLVGLGFVEGNEFVVEQFLMRDYASESELLCAVAHRMESFQAICTFNGNSFDLPLLESRFIMCRLREKWQSLAGLDLLFPARRAWKLRLGSCRLSRLEEMILGQGRKGDLPGSEVPQRYFDYLKCGDMSLLDDVIEHNRQDVFTLGALLTRLCDLYAHPEREACRPDLFSLGRALERQGELASARELYRIAAIPPPAGSISTMGGNEIAAQAAWRMYLLARKNRDEQAMEQILERMALRRQMREKIYVELSKFYEHRRNEPRRALRYADLAARYVDPEELPDLDRRRERLRRKIESRKEQRIHGIF